MSKAIREAYGEALVKYGNENENIVVLDADVSSSTRSCLFGEAHPTRFFNVGVAEANMTAMAAGFSTTGKIPFVNTFAVFLQSLGLCAIRSLIAYTNLNVKIMGAYAGLSDSYDGPTHHTYEDIAIMQTMPNIQVFVASDETITDFLVKNAIDSPSPMYIRLSRDALPNIYRSDTKFVSGKGNVVRNGEDLTIIACGLMVSVALEAAMVLAKQNINARVVDMFCIKPLDKELIIDCAKQTGAIVTAEEHSVVGGLGSAISSTISQSDCLVPLEFVGMQDCFAECGAYSELLEKYSLDAKTIVEKSLKVVARKAKQN